MYIVNVTGPYLDNGGCMTAGLIPTGDFSLDGFASNATIQKISEGYWRGSFPANNIAIYPMEQSILALSANDTSPCGVAEVNPITATYISSGLTSYPKTYVNKCVLPSGEIRVISLSVLKFKAVGSHTNSTDGDVASLRNAFQLVAGDAKSPSELIQGMYLSINSTNIQRNATLLMEVMLYNSSANVLSCNTARWNDRSNLALVCTYIALNVLYLDEQPMNPDIATMRNNQPYPDPVMTSQAMTIVHTFSANPTEEALIYTAVAMNLTMQAALYMASLGQNFYQDFNTNQLYTVFDTLEIVTGFEAPLWLVCFVFASIVFCTLLWLLTKKYIDEVYGDTLYKIISKDIASKSKYDVNKVPMLMESKLSPLKIDGYDIVTNGRVYELEKMELEEPLGSST
jgi:hypothetical protein